MRKQIKQSWIVSVETGNVKLIDISWEFLEKLCGQHGESFYLLDSQRFERNYDEFLGAFRDIYPNTFIGYSYKTNYTPKLCSIVNRKGGYAEVVSSMEYDLAIKIGVPPQRIIVNGPYKNKQTIEKFLLQGSIVNLESDHEVDLVEQAAKENSKIDLLIGIRCNFKINDTLLSRFGFDVNNKKFYDVFDRLRRFNNIKIKGLHCHFPNRDLDSFIPRADKILQLAAELFPTPPEFIDIGGGYFGKMEASLESQFACRVPSYKEYANVIASRFDSFYKDTDLHLKPKLFLEPGTAIVADTMQFVTKVIDIKKIRDKDLAVTSGSKFNVGLLSSTINLPFNVYTSPTNCHDKKYYDCIDLAGYTCIESDYLYKGYCGFLSVGDYIVFDNVGSYSVVFKPPFILPNVAVLEYDSKKNSFTVVKRQEVLDDIFRTFTFQEKDNA